MNKLADLKSQYRLYSRRILKAPTVLDVHRDRINVALSFIETEPLQGALADMFYGCWYDMPLYGSGILERTVGRLRPDVLAEFQECINRTSYVDKISKLGTRWSVLVTPSLNVAQHRIRIGSDDSRQIVKEYCADFLQAREDNDVEKIAQLEQAFFSHCLACEDRLAFSIAWFRLGRAGWNFDERWTSIRQQLQ